MELASARVLHTAAHDCMPLFPLSSVPKSEVTCSLMYGLPLIINGFLFTCLWADHPKDAGGELLKNLGFLGCIWVYLTGSLSSHIELPAVVASPLSCLIFALLPTPIFCVPLGTRGNGEWFVPACGYQKKDANAGSNQSTW